MLLASAHFLPGLDWLIKLGIGLIVAAAGVLLIRKPWQGGLGFALGLFIAETGTLVAMRALVAAGTSTRWQYLMPFALVLVPGLFVAFILTRLGWWQRAGFTSPRDWRAPQVAVPLILILALPVVGLSARGTLAMTTLVFGLQLTFMGINVFMEEATYRGLVLEALASFTVYRRVLISSVLFGFSHIDNLFLPGADELGVAYQIFEAMLIGVLLAAARLRMKSIWPVMAVHAAYNFLLILAFGHAFPVAPTLPGFAVDTTVNVTRAVTGLFLLRRQKGSPVSLERAA